MLERTFIAHDVKERPDVGHSFMNNHQSICFKAQRFAGIGYNEPATLDARRRIAAFFRTHPHPRGAWPPVDDCASSDGLRDGGHTSGKLEIHFSGAVNRLSLPTVVLARTVQLWAGSS